MSLQQNELTETISIASSDSYELSNETTSTLPFQTFSKQLENSEEVYPGIPEFPPSPIWLFALKTIICLAVVLVTIIGNSLVVLSFIKFKKLQTYTNYYIVTLAVADLASGITPIVLNVTWLIGYWPFGNTVCMVSVYLNTVFVHMTFLLTFIICVDRYRALCMPLKHLREKNRRHAAKMLLPGILIPFVLWSVVILILPPMGVFRPVHPFRCYIPYASSKVVLLSSSIVISWIPIVGTSCLYSFIYFRVIRKRLDNKSTTTAKTKNPAKCGTETEILEKSSPQQLNNDSARQFNNDSAQQLNNDSAQKTNNVPAQQHSSAQQPHNGPAQQPNSSAQQPNGPDQQPNSPDQQLNSPDQQLSSPDQQPNSPDQQLNSPDQQLNSPDQQLNSGSAQQLNHCCSSHFNLNKSCKEGAHQTDEHPNNIEIVIRSIGVSQKKQGPLRSTYHVRSLNSSRRATRTLAYIIAVMVISGTPYSIYSLLITIWPDLPYTHTITWLVGNIVHLSSATNPLCYATCNPLFKQAFIRLLCCGLRWRKKPKSEVFSSGL